MDNGPELSESDRSLSSAQLGWASHHFIEKLFCLSSDANPYRRAQIELPS